ncbi:MAG: hypothetical protein HYZ72_08205 [Deltaproteobacteria bacterium]|nr:hypothetical protein [Deltaproteobacteria bacterium]
MRIDEPGRDDQVRSVDDLFGAIFDLASLVDFGDPAAGHGYVRPIPWRAGAIDHGSVLNE